MSVDFVIVEGQVGDPFWPEIAYDQAQDRYLLIWSELNGNTITQPFFSQAAYNLCALALDKNGSPLGAPTLVTTQLTFYEIRPAYDLANNPNLSEFLVVGEQPRRGRHPGPARRLPRSAGAASA